MQFRVFWALTVAFGLLCVVPAGADDTYHVNCGGGVYTSHAGTQFLADQEYLPGSYGYLGGELKLPHHGYQIQTVHDMTLYCSQHDGEAFSYLFDVPAGSYLVTMALLDPEFHRAGKRVMDCTVEGSPLLTDFDLLTATRPNTPVTYVTACNVTDGTLNIVFSSTIHQATVAAISVEPIPTSPGPPATPDAYATMDGYSMAILTWTLPQNTLVAGHKIYRSETTEGPYDLVSFENHLSDHYFDIAVDPGEAFYYCVSAVDVFGAESELTAPLYTTALSTAETDLPVYELFLSQAYIDSLNDDVTDDDDFDGGFLAYGTMREAEIRYRGSSSRRAPKISWRAKVDAGDLFENRQKININAEWAAPQLINSKIVYSYFDSTSVLHSSCKFVHLQLNGEYLGVFLDTENPDEYFFLERGVTDIGNLYKCYLGFTLPTSVPENLEWAYKKKTNEGSSYDDIYDLLYFVNESSDTEFAAGLDARVDLGKFIDFYAVNMIASNWDFIIKNYFLYNNPVTGLWEFIPWDVDARSGPYFDLMVGTSGDNVFYTRFMHVPEFRLRYLTRLEELAETTLHPSNWSDTIQDIHDTILFDGLRDVWKLYGHHNSTFSSVASQFVGSQSMRRAHIVNSLGAYADDVNRLFLNEVCPDNATGLIDEQGEHEPWLELVNGSPRDLPVSGYSLSDDPGDPIKWAVPDTTLASGEKLLVWLDGETADGPYHANFTVAGASGALYLTGPVQHVTRLVDVLTWDAVASDQSYGRFPDSWVNYYVLTPSPLANNPNPNAEFVEGLAINEIMADNDETLADAFGEYDDWIELTNTGATPLDLQGLYLTDSMDDPTRHQIQNSLILNPSQHLLLWADGQTEQGEDHLPFKLSADGERFAVFASDGTTLLAQVIFGPQFEDHTYQRFPDGTGDWTYGWNPSPELSNPDPRIFEFLHLNELMSDNESVLGDEAAEFEPWLEIRNPLPVAVDLNGLSLADAPTGGQVWDLPAEDIPAEGYVLVFADGEPSEGPYHATVGLDCEGGFIGLYAPDDDVIDIETYPALAEDEAYARIPDGGNWYATQLASPGGANPTSATPLLVINEFLASNDTGIQDETGAYEDWMEIFNPGLDPVPLQGMFLSDDLGNSTKWEFPDVTLDGLEYLIVWCDDDENDGPLHTNFKLSAGGEELALFESAEDGNALIDAIVFGSQTTDVSMGRLYDAGLPWVFFTEPTPGEQNHDPSSVQEEVARKPALFAPYPNPFNPKTKISFYLPEPGLVRIAIFDLRGRRVRNLVDGRQSAGQHEIIWQGRDDTGRGVSSGTYCVRMTTANETRTRPLMLLK